MRGPNGELDTATIPSAKVRAWNDIETNANIQKRSRIASHKRPERVRHPPTACFLLLFVDLCVELRDRGRVNTRLE